MARLRWWVLIPVVLVVLFIVQVARPVPTVRMEVQLPATFAVPGAAPQIPWPTAGQSAVAIMGVGMIGTSGGSAPQPIASLTKMMVGYLALKDHPLGPGEDGPKVTVTAADAALYRSDLASGQSVLPVAAGEVLTERQMLQGLLLPSGNNIANLIASWDAGSEQAFVTKMNAAAAGLGMSNTHYADASGFDPATVSTAVDQIKLAEAAMANPTFAEIVKLPQVTLPVAGVVYNVNAKLGQSGIVGVKTGSTTAAGGCYVVASQASVGGRPVMVLAAVLGQGGAQPLPDALVAGQKLVSAAPALLTTVTPVHGGTVAATLVAPWAKPVQLTLPATPSPTWVGWGGMGGTAQVAGTAALGRTVAAGTHVAQVTMALGTQRVVLPLTAAQGIPAPSLLWRLTRP